MAILTQFVLRLVFGLALSMAITSSRRVTSGYFRNHLYVLLGLNVLAGLAVMSDAEGRLGIWLPLVGAVTSYVGSVCWLYERPRPGIAALWVVSGTALAGAWLAIGLAEAAATGATILRWLDPIASGLVLGTTMAAMLLGHWYLNSPGMQLAPLRRLVVFSGAAVVVRAALCGIGLAAEISVAGMPDSGTLLFIALRWLAGLVGTMVVVVMTWHTLKIPNTQSATGILYVGVITTFLGELTALLLSVQTVYPL